MGPRAILAGARQWAGQLILASPLPDFASPNFGPRRGAARPSLIVIHYTAMADCAAAKRVLCDPKTEVSAHYLLTPTGGIHALVPEEMRAWHAGAGAWGMITDINSHSIGIELSNTGFVPFAAPQMAALDSLLTAIMARWQIAPSRVIAHSDCAPGRKIDPGPRFDWRRLARSGLSIWPSPVQTLAADANATDDFLRQFGYTSDVPAETRLAAFRLRFRPGHSGPADATDLGLARALAQHWPSPPLGVMA